MSAQSTRLERQKIKEMILEAEIPVAIEAFGFTLQHAFFESIIPRL